MNEKMESIINVLRRRAKTRQIFAYFSIFGVVMILLGGLYIFIFESPKIAAQDIEQQRKLGSSDDSITGLASLIIHIQKNKKELEREDLRLASYQRIMLKDGNECLGRGHVRYWDREFKSNSKVLSSFDFDSIEKFLTSISEYNSYFSSERAKHDFIKKEVDALASLKKELKRVEIEEKNL